MLLNTSIFVADIFNKNEVTPLTKNEDVYGAVNIDNIPSATNSAKIVVSGSLINYTFLKFYINDEKVKEKEIKSSDSFSEEIGDLVKGNNEVYVKAFTKDKKNSKKTEVFQVFYNNEKPKLEVSEPADNSKTSKSDILIKGITDKEVFIKINDFPVVVNANGDWQTTIKLKEGDNSIVIFASDLSGNTESKTLTINYQKEE